jgi:hypothetical protein
MAQLLFSPRKEKLQASDIGNGWLPCQIRDGKAQLKTAKPGVLNSFAPSPAICHLWMMAAVETLDGCGSDHALHT